jgi:hypothetical protein
VQLLLLSVHNHLHILGDVLDAVYGLSDGDDINLSRRLLVIYKGLGFTWLFKNDLHVIVVCFLFLACFFMVCIFNTDPTGLFLGNAGFNLWLVHLPLL